MSNFIISVAIIGAYTLSIIGWGKLTLRLSDYSNHKNSLSYETLIGIASLIIIGGILNTIGIAYANTLNAIIFLGWILASYFMFGAIQKINLSQALKSANEFRSDHFSIFITGFIAVFVISQLLPSNIFNYHDDMHSYLTRITLMIDTGSLGQNPIGLIGLDSLGAQSYMQAFPTNLFGLKYANGFDAVFCFILSCALTISLARHFKAHWLISFTSLLSLLLINMQQVNISSVYSTTALVLGLVHACIYLLEISQKSKPSLLARHYIPLLLVCASLIAMKLLTAVFTSIFFILFFTTFKTNTEQSISSRLTNFIKVSLALIIISAPWFLVHIEKYTTAITTALNSNSTPANFDISSNIANLPIDKFLSSTELFWGGSHFVYNSLFIIVALVFLYTLLIKKRDTIEPENTVLIAICGAYSLSYILAMLIFEYNMALRYSLPMLTASVASTYILITTNFSDNTTKLSSWHPLTWISLFSALVFQIFLVSSFSKSFDKRISLAKDNNGIIMFGASPSDQKYMDRSFSAENQNHYTTIQNTCPKENGILAWVSRPFLFDYTQNNIVTLSEPQTLTPWFNLPIGQGTSALRTHLTDMGIQCVIWEYKGRGMKALNEYQRYAGSENIIFRRIGEQVVALTNTLSGLAKEGEILHNKNGLVVFNLSKKIQNEK